MLAHGHSIAWGTHIGRSTGDARGHWLHRLRQWLTGRPLGGVVTVPAGSYRGWDSRRERLLPLATESALEHEASRGGQSWCITLHSAAL
jgi:hypothetical protein